MRILNVSARQHFCMIFKISHHWVCHTSDWVSRDHEPTFIEVGRTQVLGAAKQTQTGIWAIQWADSKPQTFCPCRLFFSQTGLSLNSNFMHAVLRKGKKKPINLMIFFLEPWFLGTRLILSQSLFSKFLELGYSPICPGQVYLYLQRQRLKQSRGNCCFTGVTLLHFQIVQRKKY